MLPLIAAAVALLQPTLPQADPLAINGKIPASYQACADQVIADRNAQASYVKFDCTDKFLARLPGNAGSTAEMNAALNKAIDAGDAYLGRLKIRVANALFGDGYDDYQKNHSARAYFDAIISQQRAAAESFCAFEYDYHALGSIRGAVAGSCRIERIDRLAGDLIYMVPSQHDL